MKLCTIFCAQHEILETLSKISPTCCFVYKPCAFLGMPHEMDLSKNDIFLHNKSIEEQIEFIKCTITNRINRLYTLQWDQDEKSQRDGYSTRTAFAYRSPYVRDFRGFSPPDNEDIRQIQQVLSGERDASQGTKLNNWTKEAQDKLTEAVFEHYSKSHIIQLIKQKNQLLDSNSAAPDGLSQKINLIEEQIRQVKEKNDPRIFVPDNTRDTQIDWLSVSAKLTSFQNDSKDCRLMWSNQLHWNINKNNWTKDEDIALINAVAKYGKHDWDLVATELNTNRLAWQCAARYISEYDSVQSTYQPGSDETDLIIGMINLCKIGNYVPWSQVMHFIRYHNLSQLKHLWRRYCDQQHGNHAMRHWSLAEDWILLKAVERFGERDWSRVATCIPGRSNKSCRERYIMRVRYQRRSLGSWRRNEDNRLMSLVNQYGLAWSTIAKHFPDRNSHQLRNRHTLLQLDNATRKGPIKHRKLLRSFGDDSVDFSQTTKRMKSNVEKEVDSRLREIFSTYLNVTSKKSLTSRGAQDELIYQSLVETLCDALIGRLKDQVGTDAEISPLNRILNEVIHSCSASTGDNSMLITPTRPTLYAFKAWTLQQDYLSQFRNCDSNEDEELEIDEKILGIVSAIFLMPALLLKVKPPTIDPTKHQIGSIIDQGSKNLYKIRSLQCNLLKK